MHFHLSARDKRWPPITQPIFLSPDMGLTVGNIMMWTVIGALAINTLMAVVLFLYSIYEFIKNCREKCKKKEASQRHKTAAETASQRSE